VLGLKRGLETLRVSIKLDIPLFDWRNVLESFVFDKFDLWCLRTLSTVAMIL
jgi:hypothetical protein